MTMEVQPVLTVKYHVPILIIELLIKIPKKVTNKDISSLMI